MQLEEILKDAKEKGASDVHLTLGIPPKVRINGSLCNTDFPIVTEENQINVMKSIMTEEQIAEFNKHGELDMSFGFKDLGRYRVNAYKQRGSITFAFRLISNNIPTPADLGIPKEVVELSQKKSGLVLVTGVTGSGKSTTLAAIIDRINDTRHSHVITLEDPIEYMHTHRKSMINQREIGKDTESFANALRAALREDPDVILVGEMRDYETISVAITAAETGHLVLATLHTIGAADTVDRMIDVFPPYQQQQIRVQLANVLEGVISQQLIPTADGKRRVAAFEVMLPNSAIRNLIREGKAYQLPSVLQTNRKAGMITMDEAIYQLYFKGVIDRECALRFAQDAEALSKRIQY